MTIPKTIDQSWHKYLQPLFDDVKMAMILEELAKIEWYPERNNVFKVFAMPLDKIKVVILGQDPYPLGQATGLAFAVKPKNSIPKSLDIIFQEIRAQGVNGTYDRTLSHWTEQGIFLLNTALTVEKGIAGSHTGIWKWFTKEVIKIISINQPCIWLLWGRQAQSYKAYIDNKTARTQNTVLEAPHPAAEAYDPTRNPRFTGCNHFNTVNAILDQQCKTKILW